MQKRFYHTYHYLKQKLASYLETSSQESLMEACAYQDKTSFEQDQEEWQDLAVPIPRVYLEALQISWKALDFTVELDQEAFVNALIQPFEPTVAFIEIKDLVYQSIPFPESLSEDESIQIMIDITAHQEKVGFISQPEVKTIYIHPNGKIVYDYHRPSYEKDDKWVRFSFSSILPASDLQE